MYEEIIRPFLITIAIKWQVFPHSYTVSNLEQTSL